MAFCKYCGKELDKDGNCTCETAIRTAVPDREHIKADKAPDGGAKKVLAIIGIIAILAVIGALALFIICSVNAYKKPVKEVVKGVNRGDTERIVSAMYTEYGQSELRVIEKEKNYDWETFISENDKSIDKIRKSKNIKKIKVDIVAKEKLDGSNLSQIEDYYKNTFDEEVKKAYRVEVKFTVKYKDGEQVDDGWLTVAKIKGDKWIYCREGSDSFDYLDALTALL